MTSTVHPEPEPMHTPEPWDDNANGIILGNLDGYTDVAPHVATVEGYDDDGNANEEATANTRRICATVNGCKGIGTEALEQGVIRELLEALDYLLAQTVDQDLKYGFGLSEGEEDARSQALAAIAKATAI